MNRKRFVLALPLLIGLLLAAPVLSAHAFDAPGQAYISGVVGHAQAYSLSCESRSAADWAAYWGVAINETEFLNRLPRSDNPNEGFVGDPNDPWGGVPPNAYGVHAAPVARQLRQYGLDAHAGTGLSWEELKNEIAAGRPAIVWVIGSIWYGTPGKYTAQDGQKVRVAQYEHTMILIGYDQSTVQLVDALTGYTVTHSLENFLASWSVLDNMAVIGGGSQGNPAKGDLPAGEPDEEEAYTVQRGDTLAKLGARWGFSWQELAAWNHISFPYIIHPGQSLRTGPPGTAAQPPGDTPPNSGEVYVVQRGDHLAAIARSLEIDWHLLAEVNNLQPPYLLYPGGVLQLPGKVNAAPPPDAGADPEIPGTYTATRTEPLFGVAYYYGLDWIRLAGLNDLSFPYVLSPGQTIHLQ